MLGLGHWFIELGHVGRHRGEIKRPEPGASRASLASSCGGPRRW
jgi:hypothetical protein